MRLAFVLVTATVLAAGCMSGGGSSGPGSGAAAPLSSTAGAPTIAGGLMNNVVGQGLTESDRTIGAQAEYRALEYGRAGQPVSWRSADADNHGEIVVGPGYQVNRLDCREYTHTIYVGGRARVSRGTACRDPSGSWRAVS